MRKLKKSFKRKRGKDITKKEFDPGEMALAIIECLGSIAQAARKLKCERATIYSYMKEFPEVKKALEKSRREYGETCKEYARDNHLTALMEGNPGATTYELNKMDPKPLPGSIDPTLLDKDELILLQKLLLKAKPNGPNESEV